MKNINDIVNGLSKPNLSLLPSVLQERLVKEEFNEKTMKEDGSKLISCEFNTYFTNVENNEEQIRKLLLIYSIFYNEAVSLLEIKANKYLSENVNSVYSIVVEHITNQEKKLSKIPSIIDTVLRGKVINKRDLKKYLNNYKPEEGTLGDKFLQLSLCALLIPYDNEYEIFWDITLSYWESSKNDPKYEIIKGYIFSGCKDYFLEKL